MRNETNRLLLERLAVVLMDARMADRGTVQRLLKIGLTEEEVMCALVLSRMGLDEETDLGREIHRGYLPKMIQKVSPSLVEDDPYVQAVCPVEKRCGDKRLTMDTLFPYEIFVRDDFRMDASGRVLPQLGFLESSVTFPVLLERGLSWMSVEPNEIQTLRPLAQAARGKVVMMGLGIGYYAFHALMNPSVTEVTAGERDGEILDMFREALLPLFPRKECLKLVQDDAFHFAAGPMKTLYPDTVLTDLWRDAGDGAELYLRMKALEWEGPNWQYWIEPTIRYYLEA